MSKVQDIFGAAPKSVLNKPLMRVVEQYPSGGTPGASVLGWNDRALNHVQVNKISGASLAAGEITLPAGEYYVHGYSSSRGDTTYNTQQALLVASDNSVLAMSVPIRQTTTLCTQASFSGYFVLTQATNVKMSTYVGDAASNGLGAASGLGNPEWPSQLSIWKLDSNIETPVISDPTMALARPMMHVQDQKANGTGGGTTAQGEAQRDLNTVLTNEISGASLSSNSVILPAGTYYAHIKVPASGNIRTHRAVLVDASDNIILQGLNTAVNAGNDSTFSEIIGKFTLTAQETLSIKHYTWGAVTTEGYGIAISASGNPRSLVEIYTDLKIWQLDAVVKQPVLVNDKLYPLPGNVIVTGNMHGLEYEYTAPNNITVQAGICMDSLNETVLTLTNPQLVTIPNSPNTVYNLFLTDDAQQVKTDTDVDGANLPAQDKRRWIGFVRTSDDGTIASFTMAGDTIWLTTAALLLAVPSTAFSTGDFMPLSRTRSFSVITASTNAHRDVELKRDNSSGYTMAACNGGPTTGTPSTLDGVPPHPIYYWETGSACNGVLRSVTMKR